ncbi:MAG: hypothetical protein UT32_C0025G0005 [Parcubacteria group bacterium GW2011_GWC2_39_14]|nr:MAG: hypothetical protein UT32_C0025G0005 [Parcubacteria group bacterium GW2011_GWC2_39_14]
MRTKELLAVVQPRLPRSRSGLRELGEVDVSSYRVLGELMELTRKINSCQSEHDKKKALSDHFRLVSEISGTPDEVYVEFNDRLLIVRQALRNFIKAYMPDEYERILFPVEKIDNELLKTVFDLLNAGFTEQSSGVLITPEMERIVFEAQRDFVLTWLNAMQINRRGMHDTNPSIGYKRTRQDRANVNQIFLENGLFSVKPLCVKVVSYHNAMDNRRAAWVEGLSYGSPPKSGIYDQFETKLHIAHLIVNGREIPVIINVRRKGFLQTLGKMLTVKAQHFVDVQDRRGLCLAYRSLEELRECAEYLRQKFPLPRVLDALSWEHYRDTTPRDDGSHDLVNPHSAPNFVSVSYYRMLGYRRYQLQHRLAKQHLDLLYCTGSERHALYHLRQYTASPPKHDFRGLFHWLFPKETYGIAWDDTEVQKKLIRHVLTSRP